MHKLLFVEVLLFIKQCVKVRGIQVLLNKEASKTLSHSTIYISSLLPSSLFPSLALCLWYLINIVDFMFTTIYFYIWWFYVITICTFGNFMLSLFVYLVILWYLYLYIWWCM